MAKKPMLAARNIDLDKVSYPLLASAKFDGIRCLIVENEPLSRKFEKIPNLFVQESLSFPELNGFDGELIVGDPTDPDCYRKTESGVMSRDGNPDFKYYVFDIHTSRLGFQKRLARLNRRIQELGFNHIIPVHHQLIMDRDQLDEYENSLTSIGHEGLIGRGMDSPYKWGRSTAKQGGMFKIKRFVDSEARIVSFEELLKNNNPQTRNNLGQAKRSSHKANMEPMDTLGTLIGVDIHTGTPVRAGSGFKAKERKEIWKNRSKYVGKIFKYKYFPVGMKDLPRHPIFIGFRSKSDL